MKRIVSIAFLALLLGNLCFGGEKQKIIFDCDIGGDIDDAFAVAMMLTAQDKFEIMGICMDYGDTEARASIALRMLYETGMDHIPVYMGRKTNSEVSAQFAYGQGFDKLHPQKQGAADFIVETLNANPGEVTLFTVGPVPNMQDVIELDSKALSNAKHIYSMFGDYHFGAKEWNARADIKASQAFISNIDNNITLSGVKVAGSIEWDEDWCRKVEALDTPLTDALTELLSLWIPTRPVDNNTPLLWDCTALGLVLWPDLFETREVYMYVDDQGHTLIDEGRDPNCEIATNVDVDEFKRRLMELYKNQDFKRSSRKRPLPGEQPVWTLNEYPSYIRQLTHFGERADWSHDGKKILFVGRTFGDVYEVEVESGTITPVTHHYYHGGYTRALYLSNGDILLSGPRQFNPEAEFEWRRWSCELWVLDKSLKKPPHKLGAYCFEGPCVSRTQLKIAWTQNYGQEQTPVGRFIIWEADIDYSSGQPQLANQHAVIDNSHKEIEGAVLEVQNYRPPEEIEIIFQSTIGVETFGFNTETGKLTNYSMAPETHEEPEGIYPDGEYTLVESDRLASVGIWATNVDFYKMPLDGSGTTERLSFFAESGKYRGTNPVVSDDGKFIAFQLSPSTAEAGVGIGIFIFDIVAAESSKKRK